MVMLLGSHRRGQTLDDRTMANMVDGRLDMNRVE